MYVTYIACGGGTDEDSANSSDSSNTPDEQ